MRVANVTIAAALAMAAAPGGTQSGADSSVVEIPDTRILALSPDGQLLAARRPEELCVYEVAATEPRACGDLEQAGVNLQDDSVVWSPDSTTLAFSENAFQTMLDGDLWTMDAATGDLTNLTDDGYEGSLLGDEAAAQAEPAYVDVRPAWAPDSRSLTFSSSPIIDGEFHGNDIERIDVGGGEPESLVPVTPDVPGVVYFGLAWAPDGDRLYYSVTYPDVDHPDNGVWVYDVASEQSTHLLENDPDTGPPALLRVAATGTTALVIFPLYWSSQSGGEHEHLALLDLETNTLSPIDASSSDDPLTWVDVATFSPDGARVLYGQRDAEGGRFFVRDLPDGKPTEVDAELDAPFAATMGGGLFWGSDGTVFVASDLDQGTILHLDP